jgi:two-component system NtrC family sensor kinase
MSAPIKTILGHIRLLEPKVSDDDQARKSMEAIEREALHCQLTVRSLLDFARPTPLQTQPVDMNELLETTWSRIENELPVRSIDVVRGFDPHLPLVQADRMQLEQALHQLMRNACEAMRFGGTMRLTTRSVGSEVQIIVADTGQGLSQEQLRHVFDPFYSINEQGQRTGMGLSIAYGVIDRHGGVIEVESQEGKGSTFFVRLPLNSDLE